MSEELEYRAYVVGLDEHFIRPHMFLAENDSAAVQHARQFVDGHDVEVWSGGRFIFRLQAAR
ncbi:MAG TPA: hypothetical protein VHY82_16595 [Acetobacteraceae bacterium]|nr:hypothetical protein [Acetobacteraceae bacterium]